MPCIFADRLDRLAAAAERIAEALEAAVVSNGEGHEWWSVVVHQ